MSEYKTQVIAFLQQIIRIVLRTGTGKKERLKKREDFKRMLLGEIFKQNNFDEISEIFIQREPSEKSRFCLSAHISYKKS